MDQIPEEADEGNELVSGVSCASPTNNKRQTVGELLP